MRERDSKVFYRTVIDDNGLLVMACIRKVRESIGTPIDDLRFRVSGAPEQKATPVGSRRKDQCACFCQRCIACSIQRLVKQICHPIDFPCLVSVAHHDVRLTVEVDNLSWFD